MDSGTRLRIISSPSICEKHVHLLGGESVILLRESKWCNPGPVPPGTSTREPAIRFQPG
jgi:hypothetical protein